MASLNKVFLMGNLTRDPELRYTSGGAAVCSFGMAVNRRYVSAKGEEREDTCFIDIETWGKQAETCSNYLNKGSLVVIEGRLQFDQWDDRETGKKRSRHRVSAQNVQFLSSPRNAEFSDRPAEHDPSPPRQQPDQESGSGARSEAGQNPPPFPTQDEPDEQDLETPPPPGPVDDSNGQPVDDIPF